MHNCIGYLELKFKYSSLGVENVLLLLCDNTLIFDRLSPQYFCWQMCPLQTEEKPTSKVPLLYLKEMKWVSAKIDMKMKQSPQNKGTSADETFISKMSSLKRKLFFCISYNVFIIGCHCLWSLQIIENISNHIFWSSKSFWAVLKPLKKVIYSIIKILLWFN